MTKLAARVLLMAFGLSIFALTAHANASPAQGSPQTKQTKNTYLKKQEKQQKKQQQKLKKQEKKALKNSKKQHPQVA